MKKLMIAAILTVVSFAGFAQEKSSAGDKLSFSAGIEAALPLGDFADANNIGIGGSLQAAYSLNAKSAVTLNAGYITYSGKTVNSVKLPALNIIPVMAGLKYSINNKLYGHGQVGMSFWDSKDLAGEKVSESDLTWSAGFGYNITSNIDVLLKFNSISTNSAATNAVGLRVAYNF